MKRDCAGVAFADSPEQVKGIAFTQGDVLVSNVRPYLKKAWLADREGVCSADVLCIRPTANVRNDYLYALLSNDPFFRYVMRSAKGSKMPRGDKTAIISMPLLLPCLEEQAKIADFLSATDDVIAYTSREVADLKLMKRGAMQRIFSQEVRFRRDDGSAYPEWETKKLGEIAKLYQPKTLSPAEHAAGGPYAVFGANGYLGTYRDKNHDTDQVCIGCRGTCGAVNYVPGPVWITGNSMVCNVDDSPDTDRRFLYYRLAATDLTRFISGNAQPQITRKDLTGLTLPMPSLDEQRRIADILTAFDTAIAKTEEETSLWRELKQGLTQQMFA